ncbi:acylphosphatase [bacterium MnTg02]|nr:acylphosphatase [bacterium MnTg02]
MAAETLHLRIKGRVQGVGFRYWVRRNAEQLHLTGWVRNRRDGTVEALFAGEKPDVDEMCARCAAGPPGANVTLVETIQEGGMAPETFEILPVK